MNNQCYMNLQNAISKLINPNVITNTSQNIITIQEENKNSTGHQIIIKNIKNCISIKLDQDKSEIYFFKKDVTINDETIFYINDEKLYVLLLELKSKKKGKGEKQIQYGKIFANFIVEILEKENNMKFKEIEYRGYIFSTNKIARKSPLKREKTIKADSQKDGIYIKEFKNNSEYIFRNLLLPIQL